MPPPGPPTPKKSNLNMSNGPTETGPMVFPLVRCYGPNLKTDRWLVVIDQVQKRVSVGGDERSAFPPPVAPRSLPRAPVAMAIPGGVNKV